MHLPIRIVFILSCLCLASCKIYKGKENPKAPILKLLISVSEGHCPSKCARLEADFFTEQRMVYRGIARMPVLGNYAYFIPRQLPDNLLSEARKLKLAELPDSLPSGPSEQRIKVRFLLPDGAYKSISAGNQTGPQAFRDFVKILHREILEMVSDQEGEKIP
jgi:hypothetical protein